MPDVDEQLKQIPPEQYGRYLAEIYRRLELLESRVQSVESGADDGRHTHRTQQH